jgi:hypothetical protein
LMMNDGLMYSTTDNVMRYVLYFLYVFHVVYMESIRELTV